MHAEQSNFTDLGDVGLVRDRIPTPMSDHGLSNVGNVSNQRDHSFATMEEGDAK